ncbi:endonuclease domain-containing protein [Neobacillus sp. B4I6]|uniref:endonuclease domain-containing protein n=1 Tax=Neobacillus sp. B4I6 TaxID=3373925 RepID=UPI003D24DCEE
MAFRGHSVSTQVPCGNYRIGIAFVGPRIAIECHGKAYHSSPQQKAHDRRKNDYLRKNGWEVLRFSGRKITYKLPQVLTKIEEAVK